MNQPTDPWSWPQMLLGINPLGKVTKAVRKLQDREAGEGMCVVLSRARDAGGISSVLTHDKSQISLDLHGGAGGCRLKDIQSVNHSVAI